MAHIDKKNNQESKNKIPSQQTKKELAKMKIEAGNEISVSKVSKKIGKM